MRFLDVPRFSPPVEITDLLSVYRARLADGRTCAGPVGPRLISYMGWPNDSVAREHAAMSMQSWVDHGESGLLPSGLRTTQQHWARVADILHLHHDLTAGHHQERRGGASISKAVHLLSKLAKSKGTGEARLWSIWSVYKDVAPLVAAAVIVAADVREHHKHHSLKLQLQHLLPVRVTLLMPELVLGLGVTIERHGLRHSARGAADSMFDPETLWRIPADIGIEPLPIPSRTVRTEDLEILSARRAGNRGRHSQSETTPIP